MVVSSPPIIPMRGRREICMQLAYTSVPSQAKNHVSTFSIEQKPGRSPNCWPSQDRHRKPAKPDRLSLVTDGPANLQRLTGKSRRLSMGRPLLILTKEILSQATARGLRNLYGRRTGVYSPESDQTVSPIPIIRGTNEGEIRQGTRVLSACPECIPSD